MELTKPHREEIGNVVRKHNGITEVACREKGLGGKGTLTFWGLTKARCPLVVLSYRLVVPQN